ncbi:MAG: hypothetical protein U0Q11_10755 [Vicinamibacterales bacterium]
MTIVKPHTVRRSSRSHRRFVVTGLFSAAFLLSFQCAAQMQERTSISPADRAVLSVMRREAKVDTVALWHREHLADGNDVVVVRQAFRGASNEDGTVSIGGMKVGIFVQEPDEPYRVFTMTVASVDYPECEASLRRVAATDLVFSCYAERVSIPNQKFLYDTRAKRFVGRYEYDSYYFASEFVDSSSAPARVRLTARNSKQIASFDVTVGSNPSYALSSVRAASAADDVYSAPIRTSEPFGPGRAFHVAPDPETLDDGPVVHGRVNGVTRLYRLPQTDYKVFVKVRADEFKRNPGFPFTLAEEIGPFQLVDDQLWFGKTFYNGEGVSGVGGLGYFDPVERKFHIFSGPEIAAWSVHSLVVEPQSVWASLIATHEGGFAGGGVVRFSRATQRFERVSDLGGRLLRLNDDVMLAVGGALTVIREGRTDSYFVDRTSGGQPRIVPLLH